MKKRFYIIVLLTILAGGCEDFLNEKPVARETTDSFLSDPATAESKFDQMLYTALCDMPKYCLHMPRLHSRPEMNPRLMKH
jgi:hypothetical protein